MQRVAVRIVPTEPDRFKYELVKGIIETKFEEGKAPRLTPGALKDSFLVADDAEADALVRMVRMLPDSHKLKAKGTKFMLEKQIIFFGPGWKDPPDRDPAAGAQGEGGEGALGQ